MNKTHTIVGKKYLVLSSNNIMLFSMVLQVRICLKELVSVHFRHYDFDM